MEEDVSSSMLIGKFRLVIWTEIGGCDTILTSMGLYWLSQRERLMRLIGDRERGLLGVYRRKGRGRSNYLTMTISECEDTLVGVVSVGRGGGGCGCAVREDMPTPVTMLVQKMHA